MKNNYRRLLKIFLLCAFVYLMLCPYASLLSAAHGGNILIQQDDFRKTKKLVKVDSQLPENHAFLNNLLEKHDEHRRGEELNHLQKYL